MGIQLIPGDLLVIMVPFVAETPPYLINHGKSEQCLKNLTKLRHLPASHPYVQTEYQEILAQVQYEQECFQGHSYWVVMKDVFTIRSNLQRFILAVSLFFFQKNTGTDSLNYYLPRIFNMIGVGEGSNSLLTTGIYGVVKFLTTIFYVAFLVDRVGQRLPLLIVATLQATAMLYLALYLRFSHPDANRPGWDIGWRHRGWGLHIHLCLPLVVRAQRRMLRGRGRGRNLSHVHSFVLHEYLLLHQLDRRLWDHAGDAEYAHRAGLGHVLAVCGADISGCGVCLLLHAGDEREEY